MSFLDIVFPKDISEGAIGGPEFSTVVITASSGSEQRVEQWERPRIRWEVSQALRTPEQGAELLSFFYIAKGRLHSFRFQDPSDYEATNAPLTGAGTARQLVKDYVFGPFTYRREIYLPDATTVSIKRNGVAYLDYTLDDETGAVTLSGLTTGTFTWSGEFYVRARFDIDEFRLSMQEWGVRDWQSIPILELLV